MTPELTALIRKEAEEKYPISIPAKLCSRCNEPYCENYIKHGSCGEIPDYQNIIDNGATIQVFLNGEPFINSLQKNIQKALQQACIEGAIPWAEKLESIREEVSKRLDDESRIILSIIDKHLKS